MTSSRRRVVAASLVLLTVLGAVTALPAVALEPVSSSTYTRPAAPGATAEFRATVAAQPGDSIAQNGLKSVTLDFSADPDYSGSVADVTARDVEVRVSSPGPGNGTVPAGPVQVSSNPAGDQLTVTLLSAYQRIQPGDRITVTVDGVRNTEIAIPDPQGPRGFALDVSATDPQGNTDGPVEARYTIDPSAQAGNASTTAAAGNATGTAGNATGGAMNGTAAATSTAAGTTTGGATETASTTETSTTTTSTTTETTTATATATETTTTTTAAGTTTGGQATETTGPGFGLLAAVVALLAAGLLAARRRA